ncbi:DUF4231 domain-containing protein [Streptosporangium nondiastaticum]|uniref:DUF4231 domain-containing protein n=2 Tax=Actinomycetes TaxID=1760 RepID=A0A9X7JKK0_9ACTN|nr:MULTISPECIES: SLATT domain-containing protein [Actinomycetes]PSJ25474.1 DUF4231 domain-containing protein [Streptosporangium nondiastaticum]WKU43582.1 SLATT domain-containing protein [Streptomyces sp. VNUA116]
MLRKLGLKFSAPRWRNSDKGFTAATERYVLEVIDFYDIRATWHRRFYRLSGALVILAGAALPVLTALDFTGKSAAISGTGFLVAVTTAMKSLYRWDVSWILLRETEVELTRVYLQWCAGGLGPDGTDGPARSANALLDAVFKIRRRESSEFFKNLPDPGPAVQPVNGGGGARTAR